MTTRKLNFYSPIQQIKTESACDNILQDSNINAATSFSQSLNDFNKSSGKVWPTQLSFVNVPANNNQSRVTPHVQPLIQPKVVLIDTISPNYNMETKNVESMSLTCKKLVNIAGNVADVPKYITDNWNPIDIINEGEQNATRNTQQLNWKSTHMPIDIRHQKAQYNIRYPSEQTNVRNQWKLDNIQNIQQQTSQSSNEFNYNNLPNNECAYSNTSVDEMKPANNSTIISDDYSNFWDKDKFDKVVTRSHTQNTLPLNYQNNSVPNISKHVAFPTVSYIPKNNVHMVQDNFNHQQNNPSFSLPNNPPSNYTTSHPARHYSSNINIYKPNSSQLPFTPQENTNSLHCNPFIDTQNMFHNPPNSTTKDNFNSKFYGPIVNPSNSINQVPTTKPMVLTSANQMRSINDNGYISNTKDSDPTLIQSNCFHKIPTSSVVSTAMPNDSNTSLKTKPYTSKSLVFNERYSSRGNALSEMWAYLDPNNEWQGPFESLEMVGWYRAGFFDDQLLVQRLCDTECTSINDLKEICGESLPFAFSHRIPHQIKSDHLIDMFVPENVVNSPSTTVDETNISLEVQLLKEQNRKLKRQLELFNQVLNQPEDMLEHKTNPYFEAFNVSKQPPQKTDTFQCHTVNEVHPFNQLISRSKDTLEAHTFEVKEIEVHKQPPQNTDSLQRQPVSATPIFNQVLNQPKSILEQKPDAIFETIDTKFESSMSRLNAILKDSSDIVENKRVPNFSFKRTIIEEYKRELNNMQSDLQQPPLILKSPYKPDVTSPNKISSKQSKNALSSVSEIKQSNIIKADVSKALRPIDLPTTTINQPNNSQNVTINFDISMTYGQKMDSKVETPNSAVQSLSQDLKLPKTDESRAIKLTPTHQKKLSLQSNGTSKIGNLHQIKKEERKQRSEQQQREVLEAMQRKLSPKHSWQLNPPVQSLNKILLEEKNGKSEKKAMAITANNRKEFASADETIKTKNTSYLENVTKTNATSMGKEDISINFDGFWNLQSIANDTVLNENSSTAMPNKSEVSAKSHPNAKFTKPLLEKKSTSTNEKKYDENYNETSKFLTWCHKSLKTYTNVIDGK